MKNAKQIIEALLAEIGVTINGDKPYDLQVHNEQVYARVLKGGSLAFGESYMDGWWDCEKLDELFHRILSAKLDERIKSDWEVMFRIFLNFIFNPGKKSKAFEVGQRHYDIGNDLYEKMLDKRMTYTCGYWREAKNLDEAQVAKLDLVCRKIALQEGDKVLDIGSGWGSFMGYAAEFYKAQAIGVTVSKEQQILANQRYRDYQVETRLQDYRDLDEKFDHVVSLGMFEHVGYKNYRHFMQVAHKVLADDGLFLLHTIGSNHSVTGVDPWTNKYIFPNGMLPSLAQITKAIEHLFIVEDVHNFGADYDKTLMAWFADFDQAWASLKDKYSERFYRMWKYYLLSCAGSFRARHIQLWQIVLSKKGVLGGYQTVR